jgi:tetratricopeptide (TPR) repeat protein
MGFFDRFKGSKPAAPTEPQDDMAIARAAVDKRDWKHAAFHVAGALAKDPSSEEAFEILDFVATAAGPRAADLLAGIDAQTAEKGVWFGTVALRAELVAREGEFTEALSLLMQVIAAKPDAGYQAWIERWEGDERFTDGIAPMAVLGAVKDHAERPSDDAAGEAARDILRATNAAFPGEETVAFYLATVLRRGGRPDEAIEVARSLLDLFPESYVGHVALYNALRDIGELDEALEQMHASLALKPEEDSVRLDIGDTRIDQEEWAKAIEAYGKVLAKEPRHAWALPSTLYCRIQTGDAAARAELEALALEGNKRAQELASADSPYAFGLFPAAEATINVILQVFAAHGDKPAPEGGPYNITVTLSALEVPSSLRSSERELARRGWNVDLVRKIEALQQPDPRVAKRAGLTHVLWAYDGGTPKEVPAPPKPAVAERIGALAASPYAIARWKPAAREAGSALGPAALEDLLAVLVHPPASPQGTLAWDWTIRVQTAAALVIASLPGGRAALLDVLDGPEDWTSCAAAIALAELALDDASAIESVRSRFVEILKQRPDRGYWCLEAPLVLSLLRFPGNDPELVDVLKQLKARLAMP